MTLFKETPSGILVNEQERILKNNLVFDGSNLIDNKAADTKTKLDNITEATKKALEAPIPNIEILDNRILLRAVPLNNKELGGGLVATNYDNFNPNIIHDIVKTDGLIDFVQEVLIVGEMAKENYKKLKPGIKVRLDENNFINSRAQRGNYDNELYYHIPTYYINGYEYVVIEAHTILYITKE